MPNILAVIVTYNPDVPHLDKLLKVLLGQVSYLLVVDNNSEGFQSKDLDIQSDKIEYIFNLNNLGLATAYNQACSIAKERGCSHIILFDQDSLPATNMVQKLYLALNPHNHHQLLVAAAGPKYRDIKGQQLSPFVRIKNFHLERVVCNENDVVDVDHLISSGTLIDMRALSCVGDFADDLFIDGVDTEWCLRVRHHQLRILGVGNAFMDHNVGERYIRVLGRDIPMHTPMRLQYQFRNQIWLMMRPWVGWRWRIIDAVRCIKLIILYSFFAPNKRVHLCAIKKGIFSGLTKKMGKI